MITPAVVERHNLVSLVKLCVRDLLDSALQNDKREVDGNCVHLRNFLSLLENVLKHQIKCSKRTSAVSALLSASADPDRALWSLLEAIPGAGHTTESARHIPSIHTPIGRCRAWIRMALMQKHLADYIAQLQNCSELLQQVYHETALMRSDEYALICGLLVGVNVVDFNFYLKDEELDFVDTTIAFKPYLRRDVYSPLSEDNQTKESSSEELQTVLDQKNYMEELNKQLNGTVDRLRKENDELRAKCNSIDTAEDLAQQLQNIKSINLKLFEKLQATNLEKENFKQRLTILEKERDDAVVRSSEFESKILLAEIEHRQSRDAQEDLEGCKRQIVLLESDLKIEREWRKQLQTANHQLTQKCEHLTQEVALLKSHLKQLEPYRKKCEELDKTLEEMGAKLCDVQIETEELKEKANNNISTWQDDKEAEFCSACEKPFSVSRRRHHCRKCGQIFCGPCSESSMPLIRGGKPVRVCDSCQRELLQMYSVNSAAVQPRRTSLTKSGSTSNGNGSGAL
ncbi:RUN and FYVE domain-containing protein 2-like [Tropilaelaps mercedesae]|uniref:RUN and FYVE domain-containing protein 2-like n=1 Tax=Tropilaelaps mercedesae TaxID=418985 RepID=A0A1V9XSV9_9ACAR|nr:RUN and FYVE domain-containing protein 2-like [Tropilaelaps mercedesae]